MPGLSVALALKNLSIVLRKYGLLPRTVSALFHFCSYPRPRSDVLGGSFIHQGLRILRYRVRRDDGIVLGLTSSTQ